MLYFYLFLLLVFIFIVYMRFEAGFLQVKRVYFTKKRACLKIAHISDIHIRRLKVDHSKIVKVLKKENPDVVIATGDFIEKYQQIGDFIDFFKKIKNDYRVLICLGNHDFEAFESVPGGIDTFISILNNLGAEVLNNKSVCLEKGSSKYNIIGLTDSKTGCGIQDETINSLRSDELINIAISHNPDVALKIPYGKVDYLFCGHFHGGQIWAPFDIEFRILRHDKLCKMGVKRGLHKVNGMILYINRGLGNVVVPLRFMSRPEITVYHLS